MAGIHWIRILLVFLLMGLLTVKAHGVAAAPLEVAVVIDNSGSMRQNDPHHFMSDVVHRLATGLPAGSRMALIIFADKADLLLPLTDLESGQDAVAEALPASPSFTMAANNRSTPMEAPTAGMDLPRNRSTSPSYLPPANTEPNSGASVRTASNTGPV